MDDVLRYEVPGHVKAGVIQYLTRVTQLTPDEIMGATDIDAEEILMAMEEPNAFQVPVEDEELIRHVHDN